VDTTAIRLDGTPASIVRQANAVSDRVLDLRKCQFDGADLSAKTLSGALMSDASFKKANMQEVVMSKVRKRVT
jgi:uncharacterized protein YjbI with pentapeptide repeats